MAEYSGSCLCSTVRFKITADFSSFYLCHCNYCQKGTGSAHAANAFAKPATLLWLSGEKAVKHFALAGTKHERSFCCHCGSALPTLLNGTLLMVPAGSLDTDLKMQPTAHLFTASKASWEENLHTLQGFPGYPK